MTILHECESYIDAQRNSLLDGNVYLPSSPFDHALVIAELYLPELYETVNRYIYMCRHVSMFQEKIFMLDLENRKRGVVDPSVWDNLMDRNGSKEMIVAAQEVRQATSKLIMEIALDKQSN